MFKNLRKRIAISRRQRLLMIVLFLIGFTYWFIPPVWKLSTGPVEVTQWRKVKGEVQTLVGPSEKDWVSVKRISRHVLHAFVAAEDGRFYDHNGLDFAEIRKSLEKNLKEGRYARGGSTITQQIVKIAFLTRDKTLIRKMREAAGALLLEQLLEKDQILEWYINLVEFGDGVYGIKEGCWHYFKTKPELLTIEQAVHLAIVLPSPNSWSYGLRQRSLTKFGNRRFANIVNRMRQSGFITKLQWEQALAKGNFGLPIAGYQQLVSIEQESRESCQGDQDCTLEKLDHAAEVATPDAEFEFWDEESDSLIFPPQSPSGTDLNSTQMSVDQPFFSPSESEDGNGATSDTSPLSQETADGDSADDPEDDPRNKESHEDQETPGGTQDDLPGDAPQANPNTQHETQAESPQIERQNTLEDSP